jgi:hypothetical protein
MPFELDPFNMDILEYPLDQSQNVSTDSNKNELLINLTIQNGLNLVPKNMRIGLEDFFVPHFFKNITAAGENTDIGYIWNSLVPESKTCTLPDGEYSISDINNAIHLQMENNLHYLVDDTGTNVYYVNLYPAPVYNRYMVVCSVIPDSLPSGWSLPTGATWSLPATPSTAQCVLLDNTLTSYNLGFNDQTFPAAPAATEQSLISDLQDANITSFYNLSVKCNLVDAMNVNMTNPDILATFPINAPRNELVEYKPPYPKLYPVLGGRFHTISLKVCSTDMNGKIVNLPLTDIKAMKGTIIIVSDKRSKMII